MGFRVYGFRFYEFTAEAHAMRLEEKGSRVLVGRV